MVTALLLNLIRGVWMIEPTAAQAYYPIIRSMLKAEKLDYSSILPQSNLSSYGELKEQAELYRRETNCMALNISGSTTYQPSVYYGFDKAPQGSVAVIPLHGAVMKYDYCGEFGITTLSRWIAEADAHPNIVGIILSTDSPGGSVNGTYDFSQLLMNTRKPIVTYAHGMICSAAYWAGSSTKRIIASNPTVIVGSIGTYLTLYDFAEQLKQDGIAVHEIYADKSSDKNKDVRDAFEGNYETLKKNMINPINEEFLSAVKRNRFDKGLNEAAVLTGKTFLAKQAINYGLIDQIGTLADAVKAVQKLAA